jgi:hypothetical protein
MARKKIGARETYFPPFVNERFDPPYWACTFAALLNGANVAFLGNKPPTHEEVRKLAVASGDPELKGGANSTEMLRAMRVHYKKTMFLEALSSKRAQERLSSGWALVAGVTYRRIPQPWRRHAEHFMKGHRITLIGWNGKETWILDPMASKGTSWTGEPIPWSVIERAWWPGEQLWFAEGMFRKPPRVKVLDNVPRGEWRIPSGNRFVLRSRRNPRVIVRKFITAERKSGNFDAIVEIIPKSGSLGQFIRISSGDLKGMYIPVNQHVLLKPRPGSSGAAKPKAAGTASGTTTAKQKPAPDTKSPEFLAGQQEEYDKIKKHVGPAVILPPRPE